MNLWHSSISTVRFALVLTAPMGLQHALELGVEAEKLGFDAITAGEALFWWESSIEPTWDNLITLSVLGSRTNHIKLMTTVIDPIKRHPVIIAHMVATLDQIFPGRFMLGIGPGSVANVAPLIDLIGGPPYRWLTRTQEFLAVLEGIWLSTQENPFSFKGDFFDVEKAFLSLKPSNPPPVYLAAMGPKMRFLTGRVANGWIPDTYTPEAYAQDWQMVKQGATSVGRDANQIDRGLVICTVVLDDGEQAKEYCRVSGRAQLIQRPELLRALGCAEFAHDNLSMAHKTTPSEGKDLIDKIPKQLGETVSICGTPQEAIAQIERFIAAGVRLFAVWLPYEDRQLCNETLRHYQNTIIPYFARKIH